MIQESSYFSSTLGQMPNAPTEEFVPDNFNPRKPEHIKNYYQIRPATKFYMSWGLNYRSTQQQIDMRPPGLFVRPTAFANMQNTGFKMATTGKLFQSGLGYFNQPARIVHRRPAQAENIR